MAKRRDNGDGSIRKRTNNTWEGRILVAGDKRVYVYGKNKAEVKQKIKEALAQAEIDIRLKNPEMTVKDWLSEWLDLYRSSIKRGSKAQCETIVSLHLIPRIGNIFLYSALFFATPKLILSRLIRLYSVL